MFGRTIINEKEAGVGPLFFFKKTQIEPDWTDLSPSWINRQICTKRTIYYCLNFWLFGFFFPKRFSFWTRSLVRLFYSSESVRQADASARTTQHSRLLHAYFKIIGLKKFFKNVKFINFVVWNINIYFKLLNGHLERIKCKFKKSLLKYNIGRYVIGVLPKPRTSKFGPKHYLVHDDTLSLSQITPSLFLLPLRKPFSLSQFQSE